MSFQQFSTLRIAFPSSFMVSFNHIPLLAEQSQSSSREVGMKTAEMHLEKVDRSRQTDSIVDAQAREWKHSKNILRIHS